jgi:hypothetical protein
MEQTATGTGWVEADAARNLIEVRYAGHVRPAEVATVLTKVTAVLPTFRPGFTFLADLSALDSMDVECGLPISQLMDLCNAAGIGTVVRIIPDPRKDIGLKILSIIHYGRGVKVLTFQDGAEARRALHA